MTFKKKTDHKENIFLTSDGMTNTHKLLNSYDTWHGQYHLLYFIKDTDNKSFLCRYKECSKGSAEDFACKRR